jgi:asparagine synthase (glutamine-hydrolysing)
MAVSLEVRCPILDHVFVEFAAKIPWHFKLNGWAGKHIFKRALERRLPPDVLNRKKMGFALPVGRWFKENLKDRAQVLLLEGKGTRRYLNKRAVEAMWREHLAEHRDRSMELWTVLMLNAWAGRFLS